MSRIDVPSSLKVTFAPFASRIMSPSASTVKSPADVAIVPASVSVISPSKNKSWNAADAEPMSCVSSAAGKILPVTVKAPASVILPLVSKVSFVAPPTVPPVSIFKLSLSSSSTPIVNSSVPAI